ncbi:hypothetical protein DFH09DRAFT_1141492 [Mycena vulgaris]|nr:hypothetical protein DFH09DRAFT_1141492 [Mycena vulgaris]
MASTTTPPAVDYPKLGQLARHMSSHQRTQGYVPGAWGSAPASRPCLCAPRRGRKCEYRGRRCGVIVAAGGTGKRGTGRCARSGERTGVGHGAIQHPPPDPRVTAAQARADAERAQAAQSQADRERSEWDERERDEEPRRNGRLRTVLLLNATLSRFLAIASANTARNLETCGLPFGAEIVKGSASADHAASSKTRCVVSTLFILEQHATSDTCTMDEEGVLGFTEEGADYPGVGE